MKIGIIRGLLACLALAAVCLVGCGGGGSSSQPGSSSTSLATDATHGALSFRIVFPKVTRSVNAPHPARRTAHGRVVGTGLIPRGSHSVKITLTNPTTGVLLTPERVVSDTQRPDGVEGSISVGFALLPVGPVMVDIKANPDIAASGNPLATGSATGQIIAFDTNTLDIGLELTISSLVLTPPTQTLHLFPMPGQTGQVTGMALDANGQPLIYPLEYSVDNTEAATISAVSADFMQATIMPMFASTNPVTVNVTVSEPNSGMTATVQVIVAP
jgi:hypothetical protein